MVTELINKMLGPICTIIIIGAFAFCILIPIFELLLKKRDEAIEADRALLTIEIFEEATPLAPEPEIIEEAKGVDVHDHAVQETLCKSFTKLKEWFLKSNEDKISPSLTVEQLKKEIFLHKHVKTLEKAYSTLRVMEKYNGTLTSLNAKELDILTMVWNRINDPVNSNVKQDLVNSLILQLADASMTLEQSRCLSGRVTRIIQTLQAIDTENLINISSTEDIQREMSDKVPLLLSKYEGCTSSDLKQIVDKELRKDYIDSLLLTEEQYLRIVKDYLDAIEY